MERMTFADVLQKFRKETASERDKGARFERLVRSWFLTDTRYAMLKTVWLWQDFPARGELGGVDAGIDLVAKTDAGEYWAIQCKCYAEDAVIDKPAVDSFLATSSRVFTNEETGESARFSNRLWISTTDRWGSNAEQAIRNQAPPVTRVGLHDLEASRVDWQKLIEGEEGKAALLGARPPHEHQIEAIASARRYYIEENATRGKLIMACGTGKTYAALLIAESLLNERGLVLFMAPSIALVGQSLNAWCADAAKPIKAVCICSDSKASRKARLNLDEIDDSTVDLAVPASTDAASIAAQLKSYRGHDGLVVVFATYQSIDAVAAAQKLVLEETAGEYGVFDLIVCDEAHRTTGARLSAEDESSFVKIHSDEHVQGAKRLYMTATPRIYGEQAKIKASEKNCVLCSMDDAAIYGEEFYRVNFSYAVQKGLLTDYKVLVLTVSETDVPENIRIDVASTSTELNFDDASKLIGVVNGLSKSMRGDGGNTWNADPRMMRRAVAFCSSIGSESSAGTSKFIASIFPKISAKYNANLDEASLARAASVEARHIDGSMNLQERNEIMRWLAEGSKKGTGCRVVTNVRCLSEGVDVPSLDAVIFLSPRNSQVDVVQSVGRVMRTFHKGLPDEKKYGYIIIPIVVPSDVPAEYALDNSRSFEVVWSILNALRSHDDRFNAMVNKIALNKEKPSTRMDTPSVIVGRAGLPAVEGVQTEDEARHLENEEIARQLEFRFGQLQDGIYAKLVEKCGDRLYWENWAKDVGEIAQRFIERITRLIQGGEYKAAFDKFLEGLRRDINPAVSAGQAIEMLAQHIITMPIFEALFSGYRFLSENAVSRSMEEMVSLLQEQAFSKDTAFLEKFYRSVRMEVAGIDNLAGKQTIIKNLYEKFFKGAFPRTVEKLGIAYTPLPCVDCIIRLVEDILEEEFGTTLSADNVHILDPFVGTGTFIARLLQSGFIRLEDMERKYLSEIHCNEMVLLAYYVAAANIESVFLDVTKREEYLPYKGICLTDTFQLSEERDADLFSEFLQDNAERIERQKAVPVRVILGNPPYSVGQRSANDDAQNLSYPHLEKRIAETYAARSGAANKNSLYDTYIKAFRWASDRISDDEGGVVAFISNGGWIDGIAQEGFRRCIEEEFSSIYVIDLRGNARTSGERRRKEGGKIFGSNCRTSVAITVLVKNPEKKRQRAEIYYHDIGDYLTTEKKYKQLEAFREYGLKGIMWKRIAPNEKGDWINQRGDDFDGLILLGDKKGEEEGRTVFEPVYSNGLKTQRDGWCYNSSLEVVQKKAKEQIDYFNEQVERLHKGYITRPDYDTRIISWSAAVVDDFRNERAYDLAKCEYRVGLYRPFFKQHVLWYKPLNERTYQLPKLFPTARHKNLLICVSGAGITKDFSCLITDTLPDLGLIGASQCFPLYWYEEQKELLGASEGCEPRYIRHDGITDWALAEVQKRLKGGEGITKEKIFYYIYGVLHSPRYRERFADDLKKELPRVPIPERMEEFAALYEAGLALARLHLDYEKEINVKDEGEGALRFPSLLARRAHEELGVTIEGDVDIWDAWPQKDEWPEEAYQHFAVERMRFAKSRSEEGKLVADKTRIVYNGRITVSNIPLKAFEYVVNGNPAVEWLLDRLAVTIDKNSQIKNDPNDWAREHGQPRYILDLLLSVILLSCCTLELIGESVDQ